MQLKPIQKLKGLKNKRVLVRLDLDVPLARRRTTLNPYRDAEKRGKFVVVDDSRLKAGLATIEYLLKKKAKKIILIGYLDRPDGKVVPSLSLEPVAKHLAKLLKVKIEFVKKFDQPKDAQVVMLENIRFHPREKMNCKRWAKELASLGDIYVNEAFANSHRFESSMSAIQSYLPSYAGLHLQQEVERLSSIINKPKRPLMVVIGGAKIETKLPVITKLAPQADYILVGGAVANNLLEAKGVDVKESLIDQKYLKDAKRLLDKFRDKIILPVDFKVANKKILDIGPNTARLYKDLLKGARTIIWSGPLGYFENEKFATGTLEIVQAITSNTKAKIAIGGGETEKAIVKLLNCQIDKLPRNIFISVGGGAMLEFLASKELPGIATLMKHG